MEQYTGSYNNKYDTAVSTKIPGTCTMTQSTSTKKSFTINLLLDRVILVHTTLEKHGYQEHQTTAMQYRQRNHKGVYEINRREPIIKKA